MNRRAIMVVESRPIPTIEVVEEITRSGSWTPPKGCYEVDVFLVGGGGGAQGYSDRSVNPQEMANGGAGGYTKTFYGIQVDPGASYRVQIGSGGRGGGDNGGSNGGSTYFINTNYMANGGGGASLSRGGDGGSGGGTGGGNGGTNGSDGTSKIGQPGKGQGTTTKCPFKGYENVNFAGGGGSAAGDQGYGYAGDNSAGHSRYQQGYSATSNRGGGGGGTWGGRTGGSGGSGVIILHYWKAE